MQIQHRSLLGWGAEALFMPVNPSPAGWREAAVTPGRTGALWKSESRVQILRGLGAPGIVPARQSLPGAVLFGAVIADAGQIGDKCLAELP